MQQPQLAPIFTVSAPASGAELLELALVRADRVWSARAGAASFLDRDPGAAPGAGRRDLSAGHRLLAADLPQLTQTPQALVTEIMVDREGRKYDADAAVSDEPVTVVAGGGRLALQVDMLQAPAASCGGRPRSSVA